MSQVTPAIVATRVTPADQRQPPGAQVQREETSRTVEEEVVVEVLREANRDRGQDQGQDLRLHEEDATVLQFRDLVLGLHPNEDDDHHRIRGVHHHPGQMEDEEVATEVAQGASLRPNQDLLQCGDADHHQNQEVHHGDDRGDILLDQGLLRGLGKCLLEFGISKENLSEDAEAGDTGST